MRCSVPSRTTIARGTASIMNIGSAMTSATMRHSGLASVPGSAFGPSAARRRAASCAVRPALVGWSMGPGQERFPGAALRRDKPRSAARRP